MYFGFAQDLGKQLNQLKENKDAKVNKDSNVPAVDPPSNLKEQLQEMKAHHAAAVDLFVCIQCRSSTAARDFLCNLFQKICQFFKQQTCDLWSNYLNRCIGNVMRMFLPQWCTGPLKESSNELKWVFTILLNPNVQKGEVDSLKNKLEGSTSQV